MKGFVFLLLFVTSLSHAKSVEEVFKVLIKQDQVCSLQDLDPLHYFETDQIKMGPKKVTCPEDERSFFWYVHDAHCKQRFGTTGFTCVESDQAKIKLRLENTALINKMILHTQLKFENYKESLVQECCGDKKICADRFSSVEFSISPDEKPDARYNSDSIAVNSKNNKIVMSMGKIASSYNAENIDRVLLVELGHACQFAINAENANDYKTFTGPLRCDKESGLKGFKEGLGEELATCLIDEVESQIKELPENERSKFCFGKWYREVFSDMKFSQHRPSVYHWTYDMARRTPATNYPSVYKYIKCGMPASIKKSLCE